MEEAGICEMVVVDGGRVVAKWYAEVGEGVLMEVGKGEQRLAERKDIEAEDMSAGEKD